MIVWIDTETTGLDYKKEALLEIAVLITGKTRYVRSGRRG